jgi:hypothetical protein
MLEDLPMGFSVYYRSVRPVTSAKAAAIQRAADELCRGHTWLSCEPVGLVLEEDGHLRGHSKPNFQPDPDDAASAAREGLPDGSTRDLLDILCALSGEHRVDWEISHDHSDGPVGYIRDGMCDDRVTSQVGALGDLGDILHEMMAPELEGDDPPRAGLDCFRNEAEVDVDDDDDEPDILPFTPKG